MTDKRIKLIENFVSWQGEGPDSGQAMIILRFKNCNLNCPWCDTKVKMRISAEAPYSLKEIQDTIIKTRTGLLITGGEPTLDKYLEDTLSLINDLEYPIANVESNGHQLLELIKRSDPTKNVHFMYSPKIFNNDDLELARKRTALLLEAYPDRVYIKAVYEDIPEMIQYCEWLSNYIGTHVSNFNKVWLMPEGTNRADLISNAGRVFDVCEKYRFNFSSRSHIIFGFV